MSTLQLSDSVSKLPGVGPVRAGQLEALGIFTIKDLLWYAPFRYETIEKNAQIATLVTNTTVVLKAAVLSRSPVKTSKFRSMIKATVTDGTGKLEVTWFNQPFVINSLKVGAILYFVGKVSAFQGKPTLTNPSILRQPPLTGNLVPIYHESSSITSRYLQQLIRHAMELADLSESHTFGPVAIHHNLPSFATACRNLHMPDSIDDTKKAMNRFAFEEMYTLIAGVISRKREHEQSKVLQRLVCDQNQIASFFQLFPYTATPSQKEAVNAIAADLKKNYPMYRLIQGEVGSGKTTVAAFALWAAATHNSTAVLVCPTNILAQQHFETLQSIFKPADISIGLYTGKEKRTDAQILVGTHALFNIKGLKPSVVVIDEEHRFGVQQRETFFKRKKKPHFLSMTATPIPRTVALTALADRDVSFLIPHKSNANIKTWVVPHRKRMGAYDWIKKTLRQTQQQALIVCPFIEESTVETLTSVKSAKKEFDTLRLIFSEFNLALLHGKLKATQKEQLFADMMEGKTDILVTTPVVEVGVDIPKASIIVIEGAERFGLAQLHQLRGRVGRRGQEAYCLLFTSPNPLPTQQLESSQLSLMESSDAGGSRRLLYFSRTYDGNALAEYDLRHRGSGELLGVRQHGFDTLTFASWFDHELIQTCKKEVELRYVK